MLKDRFFYPLAALIALVMVVTALSFGTRVDLTDCDIWDAGYVMSGEELTRLTAQPGTQAIFVASLGGEPAFARLSSTAARDSLPPGPGIFAPLGPQYEKAFADQTIQMTVVARTARVNGLKTFDIGYFSAGSGDSGWRPQTLSSIWKAYNLTFKLGPLDERRALDHASIWPGKTAELLNVEVQSISVKALDPPNQSCASAAS